MRLGMIVTNMKNRKILFIRTGQLSYTQEEIRNLFDSSKIILETRSQGRKTRTEAGNTFFSYTYAEVEKGIVLRGHSFDLILLECGVILTENLEYALMPYRASKCKIMKLV